MHNHQAVNYHSHNETCGYNADIHPAHSYYYPISLMIRTLQLSGVQFPSSYNPREYNPVFNYHHPTNLMNTLLVSIRQTVTSIL